MTYNLTDPTRTLDRHTVKPGLAIWNYNLDVDEVVEFDHESHGQRWWRTKRGCFDASRMWVIHPGTGQRAEDALRQSVETGEA